MKTLTTFNFNGNDLHVELDEDNNPWFHANDVCSVLEYINPHKAIADHVDEDDLTKREVIDSLGRTQLANFINESGLYSLIFGSKKTEAKTFKRWVTSEVLPSIRKTGSYQAPKAKTKARPVMSAGDVRLFNLAVKTLNVDEVSKNQMLRKFCEDRGYDSGFLPGYAASDGVHHSLTELLKEHESKLSAIKVNPVLEKLGFLEAKTRQSSSKGAVSFWNVTKKGLRFGKNQVSPNNPNQTQPHWYDEDFPQLLLMVESQIKTDSAKISNN